MHRGTAEQIADTQSILTFNAKESDNMIIRGDNPEVLKALLPQFEGRVRCICIDIIIELLF